MKNDKLEEEKEDFNCDDHVDDHSGSKKSLDTFVNELEQMDNSMR